MGKSSTPVCVLSDMEGMLLDIEPNFCYLVDMLCVLAEDASLPSSPDVVLPRESLISLFLSWIIKYLDMKLQ